MSDVEEWRPVPGYEGAYEVSSHGRVLSRHGRGRMMRQSINANGYYVLSLHRNGGSRQFLVHRLVLLAFVGPCPEGQETRHLDANRLNPRLDNLAYGTHWQNIQDIIAHGHHHELRKTHCRRGHEYTPENTYVNPARPRASRTCRACERARDRTGQPRQRGASVAA